MGCNYYGKRILTKEEKEKAIEDILKDEYHELPFTHIHIGKSSAGWQFLFNHHNWQYFKSKEELIEFLKKYKISDQYDKEYSFDEFWSSVMSTKNEGISNSDIFRFGLRFCEHSEFF